MLVLLSEIFAFLIIVYVLYRYVWPLLLTMVRNRQEAVQQQVDESEAAARRLEAAHQRFDSAVAEAHEKVARIRDDARADAHRLREELKEQADREVERIKQRGEEQLVAQRDQIVRRLRAEIGALSLEQAERMIVESLSDEGARSATVDGFLDELDGIVGPDRSTIAPAGIVAAGGEN
ncbi:MAG: F0F1 ATP synthase subunit B [Pseudonocardia sp.]